MKEETSFCGGDDVMGFFQKNVRYLSLALLACVATVQAPKRAEASCTKPYVFFDLGDTLVDTSTNKFNPMFMMPGALDYLKELKQRGYRIGAISDVPEIWGRDREDVNKIKDYPTAKWIRFLNFMRAVYPEDKTSWAGPSFVPDHFGQFQRAGEEIFFEGLVFLPLKDTERKRKGSLILFERAIHEARVAGCPAIYMGEDAGEMAAARSVGFATFQVGKTDPQNFYLPVEQIDDYVRASMALTSAEH